MPKKIVICFDGTWNVPDSCTNVRKMFWAADTREPTSEASVRTEEPNHIEWRGPGGELQRDIRYYPGVGSEGGKLRRGWEGAVGEGVVDRMRQAYRDLSKIYEPGDEICVFGFSRGAFTARCFANMITDFGVPTRFPDDHFVDGLTNKIFKAYRDVKHRNARKQSLGKYGIVRASVKILGVWDTVASLGLSAIHGGVDGRYGFLNPELTPGIEHAVHAVAKDEHRREFAPVLFRPREVSTGNLTLEQAWFPGAHSDLGGGYADNDPLPRLSLGWMMERADNWGLPLDPDAMARYVDRPREQAEEDARQAPHKSWDWRWGRKLDRQPPPRAVLSSTVALSPLNLAWQSGTADYLVADTLPPAPGSPEDKLRRWNPIEDLAANAYMSRGKVTPATFAEAFTNMDKSLLALERGGGSGAWMANRLRNKLTREFSRKADYLKYEALETRAAIVVGRERTFK